MPPAIPIHRTYGEPNNATYGGDAYSTDSDGELTPNEDLSETSTFLRRMVVDRGDSLYAESLSSGKTIPCGIPSGVNRSHSLQDQLMALVCKTSDKRPGFIPRGFLEQILTPKTVLDALRERSRIRQRPSVTEDNLQQYVSKICPGNSINDAQPRFYKIFAILILIDREDDIFDFLEMGPCDADLPLKVVPVLGSAFGDLRRSNEPDFKLPSFKNWRSNALEHFDQRQWSVVSPFLAKSKTGQVRFYQLDAKDILPWTAKDKDQRRKGGYSEVQKVRIHKNHHNFEDLDVSISMKRSLDRRKNVQVMSTC
jgi:hypothetical protein